MLSPAALFLPGTEQANTKEAEFCRKTSLSLLERRDPNCTAITKPGKRVSPPSQALRTPLHIPAENHFAESIYKCLTPGVELTLCKRHDKLQHVRKGQKAEYQMTEIAPSPSLFIVFP